MVSWPRERWQIVSSFALLGLTVAAACYLYAAFSDYTKPTNVIDVLVGILSLIFCPTQLLFVGCIDCEVVGWDGFVLYLIIGVLNAALYALVGLVVASLKMHPPHDSQPT